MEKSKTIRISADHHQVHTEIMIAAPKAGVWHVLTDFAAMPLWSPSFKGITGEVKDGARVTTHFDMGEGVEDYTAALRVTEGEQYGWSENYDGIQDNHIYRVEAAGEAQTKFTHTDAFKGTADWANTADLAALYLDQYAAFNRVLKTECERRYATAL